MDAWTRQRLTMLAERIRPRQVNDPAEAPTLPAGLWDQPASGGRLAFAIGAREEQHLIRIRRRNDDVIDRNLGAVRFVPLIGPGGWSEEAAD